MIYNWSKITTMLVERLGIGAVSCTCELSMLDINRLQSGELLEPSYSSGLLLLEVLENFFHEIDVTL
jgi:hypothetical protein